MQSIFHVLFTILPHIRPFMHTHTHTFIHRRRCLSTKATPSSSVGIRCIAQGHVDTRRLGGVIKPATLSVTRQPLYPPPESTDRPGVRNVVVYSTFALVGVVAPIQ